MEAQQRELYWVYDSDVTGLPGLKVQIFHMITSRQRAELPECELALGCRGLCGGLHRETCGSCGLVGIRNDGQLPRMFLALLSKPQTSPG